MFVGYLMGVEENDVILDACSAPGGKAVFFY
jgi:16S rRNA (cytosine967-C5)-methyltransferase